MIHIIGEYYAQGDSLNFTLFKHTVTKNMNDAYRPVGYVGTVEALIELCIKCRISDQLDNVDCELHEALRIIREENTKTRELVKKAIGDLDGME